jgi:hypothetical protein
MSADDSNTTTSTVFKYLPRRDAWYDSFCPVVPDDFKMAKFQSDAKWYTFHKCPTGTRAIAALSRLVELLHADEVVSPTMAWTRRPVALAVSPDEPRGTFPKRCMAYLHIDPDWMDNRFHLPTEYIGLCGDGASENASDRVMVYYICAWIKKDVWRIIGVFDQRVNPASPLDDRAMDQPWFVSSSPRRVRWTLHHFSLPNGRRCSPAPTGGYPLAKRTRLEEHEVKKDSEEQSESTTESE